MTRINDLNTKDELHGSDKLVVWDGSTRAVTVNNLADYVNTARAEVKNVSVLLADTALSYDFVSEGDIVRTRDEGFSYTVAASFASDQDVITAGGLKLYVSPASDGRYPLQAFVQAGADAITQTAAVQKWLSRCANGKGRADGFYQLTQEVSVGSGAALQSIDINGTAIFSRAAGNEEVTLFSITSPPSVSKTSTNTAAITRGDTVISVTNAAEFIVGDWLIVSSSVDLGESYRNGEYNDILSINVNTNEITLARPIAADHQISELSFAQRSLSTNVTVNGLVLRVSNNKAANHRGLQIVARHANIFNTRILGDGAARGIAVTGDDITVSDVYVENCDSTFSNPLTSYGVSVTGNAIRCFGGYYTNCRRLITKAERPRWSREILYDGVTGVGGINPSGDYDALDFHSQTEGIIQNCVLREAGISVRSSRCVVQNNRIKRKAGAGIVTGSDHPQGLPYSIAIVGNEVDVDEPDALTAGNDGAISLIRTVADSLIAHNNIKTKRFGIVTISADNNKANNVIENNRVESDDQCINLNRARDTVIKGNWLKSGASNVARISGAASTHAARVSFTENTVIGSSSGLQFSQPGFEDMVVANNDFAETLATPLNIVGSRDDYPGLIVQGNTRLADDLFNTTGLREVSVYSPTKTAVLATPLGLFTVTKPATTFLSQMTTICATLQVTVNARADVFGSSLATASIPIMLSGVFSANINLQLGTPVFLVQSTSSGNLDLTSIVATVESASNTSAILSVTVNASGTYTGDIDILEVAARLEGINGYRSDLPFEITVL
jgi:hypothetical protein